MKNMIAMTDALVTVDVQLALADEGEEPPAAQVLSAWVNRAYAQVAAAPTEITVRLVDETEMADLNQAYRGKKGTTNVLSFPFENDFDFTELAEVENQEHIELAADTVSDFLGDIVICHQVIQREAQEQGKHQNNHYAHMVTHGVLHLCGYDHLNDADAAEMEALEVAVLAQSNIENPYI